MFDLNYVMKEACKHYAPTDYFHGLPYILKKMEICRQVLSKLVKQYPEPALNAAFCMVAFHAADQKTALVYKQFDRVAAANAYHKFIKKLVTDYKHYPDSNLLKGETRFDHFQNWFDLGNEVITSPSPHEYEVVVSDYLNPMVTDDVKVPIFTNKLDQAMLISLYRNVLKTVMLPTPCTTQKELFSDIIKHEVYNQQNENDQESIYTCMMHIVRQRIKFDETPALYQSLYSHSGVVVHNALIDHTSDKHIATMFHNFKRNQYTNIKHKRVLEFLVRPNDKELK